MHVLIPADAFLENPQLDNEKQYSSEKIQAKINKTYINLKIVLPDLQ